jgi:hypothetical protein
MLKILDTPPKYLVTPSKICHVIATVLATKIFPSRSCGRLMDDLVSRASFGPPFQPKLQNQTSISGTIAPPFGAIFATCPGVTWLRAVIWGWGTVSIGSLLRIVAVPQNKIEDNSSLIRQTLSDTGC